MSLVASRAATARRASRWSVAAVAAVAGCVAGGGLAAVWMPTERPELARNAASLRAERAAGVMAAHVAAATGHARAIARLALTSGDGVNTAEREIEGAAGITILLRPGGSLAQPRAASRPSAMPELAEPAPGAISIVVHEGAAPPATGSATVTFPLGRLFLPGDGMEVALLRAGPPPALLPSAAGPLRPAERQLFALSRTAREAPGGFSAPADNAGTTAQVAWSPVAGTNFTAVAAVHVAPVVPRPALPAPVILAAILGAVLGILAANLARRHAERQALAATLARTRRDHDAAIRALAERQDLETLGRLTAGVAHDMGNVMQVVETYLRALPGAAGNPAETARLLDRARGAARRGANGARDLLALARGSSRRPRPVDVPSLLAELADVMQELLGENFSVRLELPGALPPALADPGDLEAMLVNLATNSRDAMAAAGSGVLTISAALIGSPDTAVPDGAQPGGEWIRIDVVDTGIGMDAETLANAMEPFFTTKPRGRGTGLGLALAREFAERSGGMLQIESTPGVGTRASLLLHPVSNENLTDDVAVPDQDDRFNTASNAAPPRGVMHIKG